VLFQGSNIKIDTTDRISTVMELSSSLREGRQTAINIHNKYENTITLWGKCREGGGKQGFLVIQMG
jgi:hypothetical protein